MIYMVSYDLQANKDYGRIVERLGQGYLSERVLLSQWWVQSDLSGAELLADLRRYLDDDDRLLVSEMFQGWVGWNLRPNGSSLTLWNTMMRRC